MEPWKCVALLAPPVQTTELETHFDVIELRHACENIIRVLSKQSPLYREGALISRFVYKYDKKFRNDIGYRMLKKNYSTLRKYLQVNLLKDVENFTAILPNEDDNFIPTRQMLQYLLSRIITFSKLMLKMYVCSKQAAVFYMDRVKRGESHWMSLMPYALLSRIWSMSAILLQHATSWYSCLYTFLPLLQLKGLKFLPGDYQLPKDLGEWLDLKNLDTFGKLDWSKRKSTTSLDLLENEEDDIFGNILEYANNINEENLSQFENYSITEESKVDTKSKYQQVQLPHVTIIDHGQAISRDSFESLYSTPIQNIKNENVTTMPSDINVDQVQTVSQKSCQMLTNFQKKITNENKGSHYFGKVTNAKSLNDFLDREEIFRNDGNSHSLTKHLSFMQWHSLRTSLLKVCKSVLNNRKIERKLQKVWKEKCLDYL